MRRRWSLPLQLGEAFGWLPGLTAAGFALVGTLPPALGWVNAALLIGGALLCRWLLRSMPG